MGDDDGVRLKATGEFLELADAASEFRNVAEHQQHQVTEMEDDNNRILSKKLFAKASSRTVGIVAFTFFCILILGATVSLNIYSIFVGIDFMDHDCDENLSAWACVEGFVGLLSASLLIVVSIPPSVGASRGGIGGMASRFPSRLRPPSFARETEGGGHSRVVVIILGLVQILFFSWTMVGTVWVIRADADVCPYTLYWFCFAYVVGLWCLLILLCAISCILLAVQQAKVLRSTRSRHQELPPMQ